MGNPHEYRLQPVVMFPSQGSSWDLPVPLKFVITYQPLALPGELADIAYSKLSKWPSDGSPLADQVLVQGVWGSFRVETALEPAPQAFPRLVIVNGASED